LKKLAWGLVLFIGVVVGGLAVIGAFQRPQTTMPAGARGRHVDVDGTPIRYHQAGTGRDIVLAHGSPGSVEDWEPVFDRLAQRFRVTAYDRHGHGYSGGAGRPNTPTENARVALGLLRALGLRDVVFVGHSYGGITGLALATGDAPEVAAFVFVSARAYPPINVDTIYSILDLPLVGPGFARVMAPFIGPGRVETGARLSFGPNVGSMPPGFVGARAPLWSRPTIAAALAEERTTLTAALTQMGARYAVIRKPVAILCGDQDPPNTEQAKRLAAEIPGARLVMLPDTGHYVQYARPDELVAVIDEAAARLR
jgi:pimeloyl-ACP methyl ester carboxylesterase